MNKIYNLSTQVGNYPFPHVYPTVVKRWGKLAIKSRLNDYICIVKSSYRAYLALIRFNPGVGASGLFLCLNPGNWKLSILSILSIKYRQYRKSIQTILFFTILSLYLHYLINAITI